MSFLGAIVFIIIIEILLSISTVYNSIALADALSASGIFKMIQILVIASIIWQLQVRLDI